MKNLTIALLTVVFGLSAFAEEASREFKEAAIRLVEQGVSANSLSYEIVGHPREGQLQSEPAKPIRSGKDSGDIALQFTSRMRAAIASNVLTDIALDSFSCSNQSGDCELSMMTPVSIEDRQNGVSDRAYVRFTVEVENGMPVRIKNNRVDLHLYAASN